MKYTRVLIAKVALRAATEDEVFWVDQCGNKDPACKEFVKNLRELAKIPGTGFCIDPRSLIHIGDTNKTSDMEREHLLACHRCARIGQYIAHMPNPATPQKYVSLSLAAG